MSVVSFHSLHDLLLLALLRPSRLARCAYRLRYEHPVFFDEPDVAFASQPQLLPRLLQLVECEAEQQQVAFRPLFLAMAFVFELFD